MVPDVPLLLHVVFLCCPVCPTATRWDSSVIILGVQRLLPGVAQHNLMCPNPA